MCIRDRDEGIIAGGGVALLKAAEILNKSDLEWDEKVGANIIYRALSYPVYQIATNAGKEWAVVVNEIRSSKDPH